MADNLVRFTRNEKDGPSRQLILRNLHTESGAYRIGQRPDDGYLNLTAICKAAGKQFNDWRRQQSTEQYLHELAAVTGIPVTGLVQIIQGGTPYEQGSWGHPQVALRVAQWCSPAFAVQVDSWLYREMKNETPEPVTGMSLIRKQVETLNAMVSELEGIQKRQELLEAKQTADRALIEDVNAKIERIEMASTPPDCYTALGFCRKYHIRAPRAPQAIGVRASQICKMRSIEYYEVPDIRYGSVNSYPIEVLKEAAENIGISID